MKSYLFTLLIILCLVTCGVRAAHSKEVELLVTKVIDGDSLKGTIGKNRRVEVRLWGIDAPEWKQNYSQQSRRYLNKTILKKTVRIKTKGHDKYGRMLGILYLKDANGSSINGQLVELGYAWVYKRYCNTNICKTWQQAQQDAKENRRGLWQGNDPMPPWIYKRNKRKNKS